VDPVTFNRAVDDTLERLAMTETGPRNEHDPEHVTVTSSADRSLPIPLHFRPPGFFFVKEAVPLGAPVR
jgi:hypothetical protein